MLITNDEAKQMYCPFKFSHPGNREAKTCEGSKCMAWQGRVIPVRGEGGYCKLAGKPES